MRQQEQILDFASRRRLQIEASASPELLNLQILVDDHSIGRIPVLDNLICLPLPVDID